jgi:broad specificity phosphatase PhoE
MPLRTAKVIVLVRHATVSKASESQLDESGLRMARSVASELTKLSPEHIFSSPAPRARQTADIISRRLNLVVLEDVRLAERGAERLKENDFRVKWLESFDSVMSRMASLFADAPFGVSVAVTHKESIRAAISSALGMDEATCSGVKVDNCSLTTIALSDAAPRLLSLGSPTVTWDLKRRIVEPASSGSSG